MVSGRALFPALIQLPVSSERNLQLVAHRRRSFSFSAGCLGAPTSSGDDACYYLVNETREKGSEGGGGDDER